MTASPNEDHVSRQYLREGSHAWEGPTVAGTETPPIDSVGGLHGDSGPDYNA
jgi:hypothetical protein